MATQYNFHRNNSHCSIQALTHTASLDNPTADPSNPPPLPLKKKHSKHIKKYKYKFILFYDLE